MAETTKRAPKKKKEDWAGATFKVGDDLTFEQVQEFQRLKRAKDRAK